MTPYNKESPDTIEEMFSSIAKNYDQVNWWLSGSFSRLWSRKLAMEVLHRQPVSTLVDLCAGTGDISQAFLKRSPASTAFLVDLSRPMLDIAQKKLPLASAQFIVGDAAATSLKNHIADAVTVAYGIRNVPSLPRFFNECFRLLKVNGLLAILELTRPQNPILRVLHRHYLEKMVPLVGRRLAGNKAAYEYLRDSVKSFASPQEISLNLTRSGFTSIEIIPLLGGVATLFFARREKL